MARLNNNILVVLIAMLIGLTLLACVCYATIFLQPDMPFNPLRPSRATVIAATIQARTPTVTITPTPPPTFPPTWTPTNTFTPAPTKTSTNTRTPTPSRTPTGTFTPLPTLTPTPLVLPTFTPEPPFPFAPRTIDTENNCANIKLAYSVVGPDFEPISGYQVEYGEIGVRGSQFLTEETEFAEIYGVTLIPGTDRSAVTRSHNWFAYLVDNGRKASEAILFTTDPILAAPNERCDDEDDDDEDEGCILDPCLSEDAVNVKVVEFSPRSTNFIEVPSRGRNLCTQPYENFVIPRDCSDCATQEDAQRLFLLVGGPEVDIYDFDRDSDGVACENRPRRNPLSCANFATQAEAQRAFEAAGGTNLNTDPIDPDRDGIACEGLP